MNMPDIESLVLKLQGVNYYPKLFLNAYGDEMITPDRIALALESFVQCLNTPKSQTVVSVPHDTIPPFASEIDKGRFLFENKYNCAGCHNPGGDGSYSSPSGMHNIGL